jgi:hypothetical protein
MALPRERGSADVPGSCRAGSRLSHPLSKLNSSSFSLESDAMRTDTRTSTIKTARHVARSAPQSEGHCGQERPGRTCPAPRLPREPGATSATPDRGQASLRVRRDVAGLDGDALRDELLGLTRRLTSGT